MVKIEKGVPIPSVKRSTGKRKNTSKYKVEKMEVGDSVYVPGIESKSIHAYLYYWRTRHNHPDYKFTVRSDKNGVRFWRIA